MNGNIRKANAQDYQQVERLMQQVHILHANWRPDIYKHCSVVLSEERFLEHIKNEEIVVLEKENSVIGVMIYLTRNISGGLMQDRKILFIDALAVDEKERGNGFGHQLLDYLVRLYKDLQYDGLELQVNAKNLTAMELYTKYGFTPKSINNYCKKAVALSAYQEYLLNEQPSLF